MSDLFGDLPPARRPEKGRERPKPPAPPHQAVQQPSPPPEPAPEAEQKECGRPFLGSHKCRVGGGHACYSDNGGRSWFCEQHMPPNFLPKRP